MRPLSFLMLVVLGAMILVAAPVLATADHPAGVARAPEQDVRASVPLADTPSPFLRPLDPGNLQDLLLALPTPTPPPGRPQLDMEMLNPALLDLVLRAAPTPPAIVGGDLRPLERARIDELILSDELDYVKQVDPERLAILGMEVNTVGSREQLEVVSPDAFRFMKVLVADRNDTLGEPPPFRECDSRIELPTIGTVISGSVTEPGVPCAYTIEGKSGDHLSLTVESADFSPWVDLFDPGGAYLAPDLDLPGEDGLSRSRTYDLPADGVYLVVVRPVDQSATGRFTLTVSHMRQMLALLSVQACLRAIAPGQTISDETLPTDQDCLFKFAGSAGSLVSIAMESEEIDPVLKLLDPTDLKVAENDDSEPDNTNSLIAGYRLKDSGPYTIVASAFDPALESGAFSLGLKVTAPAPCSGAIKYGQTVEGAIPGTGSDCRYKFSGARGDVITIELTRLDNRLDPYLTLFGPSGAKLKEDDDGAGNHNSRIAGFTLQQSGTYTIVAGSWQGESAGPFRLRLRK